MRRDRDDEPPDGPEGAAETSEAGRKSATGLDPDQLRWSCLPIQASKRPPPPSDLLGQPRAIEALRTGLELHGPGFNVFVSGLHGSGRLRIVQSLLEELRPACRLGPDRVYVHNFYEPNRPRLVALPRGSAVEFRDAMRELLHGVQEVLQSTLHGRRHRSSRQLVVKAAEDRGRRLLGALEREAERDGLALVQFQGGEGDAADVLPVVDGEARSIEDYEAVVRSGRVSREERDGILRAREEWLDRLEEVTERTRRIYQRTRDELRQMDWRVASRILDSHFREFCGQWPGRSVEEHLAELRREIQSDLPHWAERESEDGPAEPRAWTRFDVYIVQAHDGDDCPVVVEPNPTYENLFGTLEGRDGDPDSVDRIHPGALVCADGGYLILRAADVIADHGVWKQLKRALKSARVEVRNYDPNAGATLGNLQPEAIEIQLKVVMIGEPGLFDLLAEEDPQFNALFKIHAEFDSSVVNNAGNRRRYADFLGWLARQEQLVEFAPGAAAAAAEFGARRCGRQDRLSTRFGELADVAREASHLARREGAERVQRSHVEAALAARDRRDGLLRERLERDFSTGYVALKTSGRVVGQVNAMTVIESGNVECGRPVRVTASTGVTRDGKSEVINIEREAELSGPFHDKGVLILQGLLLELFGNNGPRLHATLCFEQLYTALDGDSAASAEFYALISSLARVPLTQTFAVTGAVDQKGEIQAVGGVTPKVEGFWRACRQRPSKGVRGVLIPRANKRDLMLDPALIADVAAGNFVVHAIRDVREGLEILTGRPAKDVLAQAEAALMAAED